MQDALRRDSDGKLVFQDEYRIWAIPAKQGFKDDMK
jgi:hypothetical protein